MLATYLDHLDDLGRSAATRLAYESDLRDFEPTFAGVRRYADGLAAFKPATAARKMASARGYCAYLGDRAPADWRTVLLASPIAQARPTPTTLSDAELARLIGGVRGKSAARDRAILHLLMTVGCRASELVGLNRADLAADYVRLAPGDRHDRDVPLDAQTSAALDAYLAQRRATTSRALFVNHRGERLTRQGVWLILQGHADRVGLTVTAATLRHTAAARLVAARTVDRDVQYLMGYASVNTVQPYVSAARQRAA